MANELNERENTIELGLNVTSTIPDASENNAVAPINVTAALERYSEEERNEIINLANTIDVKKVDNIMSYGAVPLKATFDQCGKFLKDESGSQADQKVIAEVIELSKKASESYDDFNLVLKEPNAFRKFLMKILYAGKDNPRTKKIQNCAISNYKLLSELQASCDSWLEMLRNAMDSIGYSALNDAETIMLLEKYIIAGKLATERIEGEIQQAEENYLQTGLQADSQEYEELKEGYDMFQIKMNNLEKSRVMYYLSLGQLKLIRRSNKNVQLSIYTQKDNSLALIGQQLRNAVLDAKNQEVLEGQKAISRLNDELIKKVSSNVALTAEDTEKLIYAGFYNVEAAKEAVTTVINACDTIQKTASEMLPKMKADMAELNDLVKQLEPLSTETLKVETLKNENTNPSNGVGSLKF